MADRAASAVNRLILDLCIMSQKDIGGPVRNYVHIGLSGYGLCPRSGAEGVESALPGALAAGGIVPLSDLAENTLSFREGASEDDASPRRFPIWIVPHHGHGAPMCQTIAQAGAHIHEWANAFPHSFPPIVVNITGGGVDDSPLVGAELAPALHEWVGVSESG